MSKKNKILNKHFFVSLFIFILVIIFVTTFISFLEDIQLESKNKIEIKN